MRRDTTIDIPLIYDMPHFITDDADSEDPLHGHFILVLQGFLCHRGTRPDAGHYVSAARCRDVDDGGYQWLLNDDLANPRVSSIEDIKMLLKKEKPYLLFYQVEPLSALGEPPAYSDSVSTDPRVVEPSAELSEYPDLSSQVGSRQSIDGSMVGDTRGRASRTGDRKDMMSSSRSTDESRENNAASLTVGTFVDSQAPNYVPQRSSRVRENSFNVRQNGRVKDKRSSMSLSRMTGRLTKGKAQSSTSLSGMDQPGEQTSELTGSDAPRKLDTTKSAHRRNQHSKNGTSDGSDRRECVLM